MPRPDPGRGADLSSRLDRLGEGRFAALAIFPGLFLVGIVVIPPVLAVIGLSLFRVELGRDDLRPFVGLNNFLVRLPLDREFLATVPRTLGFAALATLLSVPIALGSALLVNGRRRGGNAMGLVLVLPWAVAPIAAGVFWRLVFDTRFGLVNAALGLLGLGPVRWTNEALPTLGVTLVAVVWRAIPLLAVVLLGALRAVPPSLGRAARMDGASSWQVLRHITLPAIRPTLVVVCVIQIVLSLQVFDILFSITSGQPREGGDLAGYAIYSTIINDLSFGYGSALTVVLAAVIALCLVPLIPVVRGSLARRPTGADDDDAPASRGLGSGLGGMTTASLARVTGGRFGVSSVPVQTSVAASLIAADAVQLPALIPSFSRPAEAPLPTTADAHAAVRERTRGRRLPPVVGRALRGVSIAALVVWLAGPIVWLMIASVQPESALRASPPTLSTRLTFDGYQRLLNDPAWRGALANSVVVAVSATAVALVAAILAGYPLARFRFRGARAVLGALLLTQLMPPIALAIPALFLFIAIGLKGTLAGLIVVNAAFWTPILVWLVRAAFLAVPRSMEAAARMDGAGRVGAILRVAVPAAGPAIAAATVIVFVGVWNDFVFQAAMGSRLTNTLPRFLTITSDPPYHALAAGILLTIAPCLVLVAALHRRILRAI